MASMAHGVKRVRQDLCIGNSVPYTGKLRGSIICIQDGVVLVPVGINRP